MSYWGSGSTGGTYSKAKNSLIPGYNPAGSNAASPSYVTYSASGATPTPNVSYPSAASYSKQSGKVTYYTQDWNTIKQAQYKATGRVNTGCGRGRGNYHNAGSLQSVHYCEVCKITCGTAMTYKAHLEGSKHLKKATKASEDADGTKTAKMPKNGVWKCVLCDITSVTNESFKAHINGSKHDKKVQLHKRLGKPIPDNITPLNPDEGAEKEKVEKVGEEFVETKYDTSTKRTIYFCSMCNCSFMDATAKEFHILGRRHRLEYKKKYDKTLKVDVPANKRQKLLRGGYRGRGGFRGYRRSDAESEENDSYREIWEAEQRQLESEWTQYREEERWYRYIEGIKQQEEEHRQWYIQERHRCESLGIAPPPPPPRPRPPPPPPARDNSRKVLNNQDANLIYTKHNQLQPSKPEVAALEKAIKLTEDMLEMVSEELDTEYRESNEYKTWKAKIEKEAKDEEAKEEEAKEEEKKTEKTAETAEKMDVEEGDVEEGDASEAVTVKAEPADKSSAKVPEIEDDHLVIKSCIRVGDLPKHSILKSNIEGVLAVFCVKKPTVTFFDKLFLKLKNKFAESEDGVDLALASSVTDATIYIKKVEPVQVEIKVQLTSTVFRDEDVNQKTIACDKAMKVLNRSACLNVLALLRQTKWFESRMSVSLIVVLQILKDLNKRIPAWSPLSTWSLELIVERCARTKGYSCQPPQFSPAEVLRRVFELFASGFLLLNSPGLNDPCEKDAVDVLGYLSAQEREDLTASAQYALRLMVYNQLYKILGVAQPAALKNPGHISRAAVPESFKQSNA